MKKKLLATLCLTAACMLVACGGGEGDIKDIGGNKDTQQESGKTDTAKKDGYIFKSNDVSVIIDAQAEEILAALGKADSVYESPSCAFGDLDKIYTYPNFLLDTYTLDGVEYISAVTFQNDSITTPEGIRLADTPEKVKEVYGAPTQETATMYAYVKGDMKLCFIFQDDVVASIEYRTMILE